MNDRDALSKTNFVSLTAEPLSDSTLTELEELLGDLNLSPEKPNVPKLVQKWRLDLEGQTKATRAKRKAEFEQSRAAEPKKHPDDYRYGKIGKGRTRSEIEQYRRENREGWNEKCRANYAVKIDREHKGRAVREYVTGLTDEEKAGHTKKKTKERVTKHRTGLSDEQKTENKMKDAERKRLAHTSLSEEQKAEKQTKDALRKRLAYAAKKAAKTITNTA
jgi:hypothetical protein